MVADGRRPPGRGAFSVLGGTRSAGLPYFPEPRPHLGGKNRVSGGAGGYGTEKREVQGVVWGGTRRVFPRWRK